MQYLFIFFHQNTNLFDYFIFKGTTGINLDNCNILLYTVYQKEAKNEYHH